MATAPLTPRRVSERIAPCQRGSVEPVTTITVVCRPQRRDCW